MAATQCPDCGKRLKVREELVGKKLKCPGCLTSFFVETEGPVESDEFAPTVPSLSTRDKLQDARAKWSSFYTDFLRLDWPFGGPQLRCCTRCNGKQFTHIRPCSNCDGTTVDLNLVAVFEGTNRARQTAVRAYHRAKKSRVRAGILIWVVACLLIIVAILVRCWLGVLISILVIPLAVLAHIGALWAICALFRRHYENRDMPSKENSPRAAKRLEKFCDEIVHPFFARNGIIEGRPVQVVEQEISLLIALFHRDAWSDGKEPVEWLEFLTACALRRDFLLFRQRVEYYKDADPIAVYANLFPNSQSDGAIFPFLREILAEQCHDGDFDQVVALVDHYRAEFRLKAFSQDLEQRRKSESINLSIAQVDSMNPFNFEELLGMIYQAEGYRIEVTKKSGDQGADVIIEKTGERSVVQAKLYGHPVGNGAVQEVLAAKTFYRCQQAIVVTNNSYTRSAVELAASGNVKLVDREQLIGLLDEFNKRPKDYGRLASLMIPTVPASDPVTNVMPAAQLGKE